MTVLLVGHRGCGKTDLLKRISRYRPGSETLDLDALVAREAGMPVAEMFRQRGEGAFRALEQQVLARIGGEAGEDRYIALGAGYQGPLPPGCRVLWVRRDTDREGRIFLDRPRLDPGRDPLEEFLHRFPRREERYRAWSDQVLTLREGFTGPSSAEECFFAGRWRDLGGILTVLPGNFRDWDRWWRRRLEWGIAALELRDDLLSRGRLGQALATVPRERLIYSIRISGQEPPPAGVRCDWPLELGPPVGGPCRILSLHEREPGESVAAAAGRLERAGREAELLKLAPLVASFAELREGDRWALAEPGRRSFLPRSPAGRWAWYRLLRRGAYPVNFFREGEGSAPDQPLLLDWADQVPRGGLFAAILGDPVAHSWTPAEHREFFGRRGMPVYAIQVSRRDWEEGALAELHRLGLRAAAVTAPLKEQAAAAAGRLEEEARDLGVANTLAWEEDRGGWLGANTDRRGLARVLEQCDLTGAQVVWGGGGTLPILQALLPQAFFYAARTGRPRTGPPARDPRLLVWAASIPQQHPPAQWRPATILDLSYRENSPGRMYAQQTGAHYLSGAAMFKVQARLQQQIWGKQYPVQCSQT